ncbi:MAG: hypothetical protein LWX83_16190 [Anaerolineae bacterium]|nr:hypothetical protein [Anaerolineae bacterium]
MADPLYRLNSARAFPSEIEDMVQHIAAVRRDFLSNNNQQTRSVRTTIRESWQRCTDLIEPGRAKVPIVISSDAELFDLYQTNTLLLQAATNAVKRLTEFVAEIKTPFAGWSASGWPRAAIGAKQTPGLTASEQPWLPGEP